MADRRTSQRRWRRAGLGVSLTLALALLAWGLHAWWTDRDPQPATEIFRGVTYGCQELTGANGRGLMHWVRVDLAAPGVELFTTPLDPEAVVAGWQYKLAYTADVAERHNLAVAINGTLFGRANRVPLPGSFARSSETLVADGVISHIDKHSFMFWFDERLRPHAEEHRLTDARTLARARWGIGAQSRTVLHGRPHVASDSGLDSRTAVGMDPAEGLLILAVFEAATPRRVADELMRLGATEASLVDGGTSSEMVIGEGARSVRPGNLIGSWMPVATHFGVRARKVE